MDTYSTRQVAKILGTTEATLSRYISAKKIPEPRTIYLGKFRVHSWTDAEIEYVRQLLPKIANGRKTRYKKQQSVVSNQQSAKTKRTQARAPALQKPKKKK